MMMTKLGVPVIEQDHHTGSLSAPVVFVEYGDFECEKSGALQVLIDEIMMRFGSELCLVYRHFPMYENHAFAELAAIASEAADQQGHFWSMQHLLFENQSLLSLEHITKLAADLELNLERFQNDLKREDLIDRVSRDYRSGIRSGVESTPAVFINGYRFSEKLNLQNLVRMIEQSLRRAGSRDSQSAFIS